MADMVAVVLVAADNRLSLLAIDDELVEEEEEVDDELAAELGDVDLERES